MVVGENFAKRSFGFVCFLLLFFANPSNQQQQKTREISEAMLLSSSNGECRCPCIGDEKNGNLQRLPKKLQSVVQKNEAPAEQKPPRSAAPSGLPVRRVYVGGQPIYIRQMFVTPLRPPPETSPEDKGLKKSVEKVVDSNDSSNKDEQTGTKKKNPDEAKTRQKRFGFAVPSFGPSYSYYAPLRQSGSISAQNMSPLNLPPRTRAILKFQRSENGIADDDLDLIDFENLLLTGLSRRNGDDGDDGGMKFTYNFGPGKTNEEEQEEEEGEEGEEIEEADDELSSEGDKNSRNALTPLPIQQQNPSLTAAEITEQQGTALIEAPTAAVAADSSSSSFLGGSTTTTYMGIQPKKGSPSYRRIPLIPAASTTKRRGRNYPRSPQQPYSVLPNAPAVPNQSNYLATPKWSNLTTKGSHDYPLPECYTNRDNHICCNAQLEEAMRGAYNDAVIGKSDCNTHSIATTVQRIAEQRFNMTFEVIAGLNSFASRCHFFRNYICKVVMGRRHIMAYATPKTDEDSSGTTAGKPSQNFELGYAD